MNTNIIDGNKITQRIKNEIVEQINELKSKFFLTPKIVSIIVGENPATKVYVNTQCKICDELGVNIEVLSLDSNITEDELELYFIARLCSCSSAEVNENTLNPYFPLGMFSTEGQKLCNERIFILFSTTSFCISLNHSIGISALSSTADNPS